MGEPVIAIWRSSQHRRNRVLVAEYLSFHGFVGRAVWCPAPPRQESLVSRHGVMGVSGIRFRQ